MFLTYYHRAELVFSKGEAIRWSTMISTLNINWSIYSRSWRGERRVKDSRVARRRTYPHTWPRRRPRTRSSSLVKVSFLLRVKCSTLLPRYTHAHTTAMKMTMRIQVSVLIEKRVLQNQKKERRLHTFFTSISTSPNYHSGSIISRRIFSSTFVLGSGTSSSSYLNSSGP